MTRENTTLVIFGATGDLMKKKLLPSLSNIFEKNKNLDIIGVGRKDFSDKEFQNYLNEYIEKKDICEKIQYNKIEYNDSKTFENLKNKIDKIKNSNLIFYLALPPQSFNDTIKKLSEQNLHSIEKYNTRVVFEKPFGTNLESAKKLNKEIAQIFEEEQVYRIDHYLGKEPIQNFLTLRFANSFFEPLWNNNYIDNIQITGFETIGVEGRAGYYDQSGALRDMLQNHLLQMLALIAMEAPTSLDSKHIRDEKVKVFEAIKHLEENIDNHIVFGQYTRGEVEGVELPGYLEDEEVPNDSKTETYVALKLCIDNFRFNNVPIYLRTGKRMEKKGTTVVIEFKKLPQILYNLNNEIESNKLILHIQPDASISMEFNVKSPNEKKGVVPIISEFDHKDYFGMDTQEAYEKLLEEIIKGDQTLFNRADSIEESWRIVDKIIKFSEEKKLKVFDYKVGTLGPKEADKLIEKDGRKWHNL